MSDPYKRDRRIGRWIVPGTEMSKYPGVLKHIQDTVVILHAQHMVMMDAKEFIGRGEQFDISEEGELIPLYDWRIVDDRVEWTRRP